MDQLRGQPEIECKNGEWTPRPPHCIPLDPEHKNGKNELFQLLI